MATKKQADIPATNHNVNTNNNTNHINVKVEYPKKRAPSKKKDKPNWILKAVVVGVVGLVLSLVGYYVKKQIDEKEKPAVHYPAVSGEHVNN